MLGNRKRNGLDKHVEQISFGQWVTFCEPRWLKGWQPHFQPTVAKSSLDTVFLGLQQSHTTIVTNLGHIPVEITQEDLCHQFVVTTRVLTACALTERPASLPPPKPYTKVSQVSGINKKRPLTKRPWPYVVVKNYDPLFAIMYCVGWFGHCIL